MSQQLVHISELLTAAELITIDALIANAGFVDGKLTASMAAKDVKNNLQIEANNENLAEI